MDINIVLLSGFVLFVLILVLLASIRSRVFAQGRHGIIRNAQVKHCDLDKVGYTLFEIETSGARKKIFRVGVRGCPSVFEDGKSIHFWFSGDIITRVMKWEDVKNKDGSFSRQLTKKVFYEIDKYVIG